MNARNLIRMAGLSLVELMVALTISLVLIFGATQVYVDSRNAYNLNETVARLQENARYAMFDVSENLVHPKMEKYGIRYLDKEEVFDHFFNSFYSVTQPATSRLSNQRPSNP